MPPTDFSPEKEKRREGYGGLIGAFIIIVLLILGALYFWGAELNRRAQAETRPTPTATDEMTPSGN